LESSSFVFILFVFFKVFWECGEKYFGFIGDVLVLLEVVFGVRKQVSDGES
jgi:hypothetical protein